MASRVLKSPNSTGIEFASAGAPLHVSELDGDLDAIFNGITDINIASGASIATAKLANDLGITSAKLAPNSVTTTKIADQNVTIPKLAIGASLNNFVTVDVPAGNFVTTTETAIATWPVFTPRGGRVFLFGAIGWVVAIIAGTTVQSVTMRLYRNTAGGGFALRKSWTYVVRAPSTAEMVMPLPTPFWSEIPASGSTQVYELRAVTSSNAAPVVSILTDATNPGTLFAVEFA